MMRRRLLLYLLLNVLVTVVVSGAFLYIYDRNRPQTECATLEPAAATSASTIKAEFVSVNGAGVLASETTIIQNGGEAALLIGAWVLKDNQGNTYTFPELTLYPGGSVQVHTKAGTNTASDLYWGRTEPVWESGELAALYDQQNIARAFYRVP
jgi:hypothetical protein